MRTCFRSLTAAVSFSLLSVCSSSAGFDEETAGNIVLAKADQYFGEFQALCAEDDGELWGVTLCGPILLVDPPTLPAELTVTAWCDDRPPREEIMGLEHANHMLFGVQFHPESIGTESGKQLVSNFLDLL